MSKPEHSGFGGVTYTTQTKTDPGAKPADNTFRQWVKDDQAFKENAAKQQFS